MENIFVVSQLVEMPRRGFRYLCVTLYIPFFHNCSGPFGSYDSRGGTLFHLEWETETELHKNKSFNNYVSVFTNRVQEAIYWNTVKIRIEGKRGEVKGCFQIVPTLHTAPFQTLHTLQIQIQKSLPYSFERRNPVVFSITFNIFSYKHWLPR